MLVCDFYKKEIKIYPKDCDERGCSRYRNKLVCTHLSEKEEKHPTVVEIKEAGFIDMEEKGDTDATQG